MKRDYLCQWANCQETRPSERTYVVTRPGEQSKRFCSCLHAACFVLAMSGAVPFGSTSDIYANFELQIQTIAGGVKAA